MNARIYVTSVKQGCRGVEGCHGASVPGVTFGGHVQFDLLTPKAVARREGRNVFGVKIIQFTHNRGECVVVAGMRVFK